LLLLDFLEENIEAIIYKAIDLELSLLLSPLSTSLPSSSSDEEFFSSDSSEED
jgi:hypothetical protein